MPVVNSTKEKAKAKVASLARSVMILNGCLKGLKMLVKIEKKLFYLLYWHRESRKVVN